MFTHTDMQTQSLPYSQMRTGKYKSQHPEEKHVCNIIKDVSEMM